MLISHAGELWTEWHVSPHLPTQSLQIPASNKRLKIISNLYTDFHMPIYLNLHSQSVFLDEKDLWLHICLKKKKELYSLFADSQGRGEESEVCLTLSNLLIIEIWFWVKLMGIADLDKLEGSRKKKNKHKTSLKIVQI